MESIRLSSILENKEAPCLTTMCSSLMCQNNEALINELFFTEWTLLVYTFLFLSMYTSMLTFFVCNIQ